MSENFLMPEYRMSHLIDSSIPPLPQTRDFLESLCAIGPRLMGSPLEAEARSFVSGFFRGIGIQGAETGFTVPFYERGAAECALVYDGSRIPLAAAAAERCPSTDTVLRAALVGVGSGSIEDVSRVASEIAGKAVFSSRPGADGFLEAAKAGAVAWLEPCSPAHDRIRMAYMPWGSEGYGCARVKLKASSAKPVADAVAKGRAGVELLVEGMVRESESANLEFTLEGRSGLPRVLVGAHLDSFSVAPGATDNGSGVAAACMVAKALSGLPAPLRSVGFLFFTGEEDGRRGSREYVRNTLSARPASGVYVNLDVPHGGKPLLHVMCGGFDAKWFDSLRRSHGEDLAFAKNMRRSSDHYSFYRAGIPCLMPRAVPGRESEDPGLIIHTDMDTLDRADFEGLQRSIAITALLTRALADAEKLPFDEFEPLPDEARNFPDPG